MIGAMLLWVFVVFCPGMAPVRVHTSPVAVQAGAARRVPVPHPVTIPVRTMPR